MAWEQWDHRNKILHDTDQPRQQKAKQLLHSEITKEMLISPQRLPRKDRHHFNQAILSLLNKSLDYKKAWISNVHAARQQAAHHQQQNTEKRENLLYWMRMGRYH